MKTEEIYKKWKEQKSQIEVGKGFSDRVMSRICQYESEKRNPLFDVYRLIELMSTRPLGKAAMIAAGGIIGLLRITFVVYTFLGC
ncbi:MAG: hypothetical protein GWN67_14605 [Phycisphaerae bacterium]|nr:hypothetical protein [Phycisphaerae bacterium]NIP50676.1 hypothetical protein [Phycisphaerae bacterium]NIS52361.1 hypothetical protein [Phycisphaerae bacterium]NIU11922.1 hypothetical protein [Phycisphaerae bacterium]NIU57567.1 hypothetical protein [Phycisphaerae bacterium]